MFEVLNLNVVMLNFDNSKTIGSSRLQVLNSRLSTSDMDSFEWMTAIVSCNDDHAVLIISLVMQRTLIK